MSYIDEKSTNKYTIQKLVDSITQEKFKKKPLDNEDIEINVVGSNEAIINIGEENDVANDSVKVNGAIKKTKKEKKEKKVKEKKVKRKPFSSNQLVNYVPNTTDKHIDYVIFYKENNETQQSREIQKNRSQFLKQLKNNGFKLKRIKLDNVEKGSKLVFVLLNCSLERLMEEAERIELQMPLKYGYLLEKYKQRIEPSSFKKFKIWLGERTNKKRKCLICAPFETEIRYVFENFETDINDTKGFSNTIRSMLVDHILTNIVIDLSSDSVSEDGVKEKLSRIIIDSNSGFSRDLDRMSISTTSSVFTDSERARTPTSEGNDDRQQLKNQLTITTGLPYMISKKYFNDAFILHDETFVNNNRIGSILEAIDNNKMYEPRNSNASQIQREQLQQQEQEDQQVDQIQEEQQEQQQQQLNREDLRNELDEKWAQIKNVFRYQPLSKIRNYFGESFTMYFAWVGTFIGSLWILTIIGIVFFVVNVILLNTEDYDTKLPTVNSTGGPEIITAYTNYFLKVFAELFDNDRTPFFAAFICLWGIVWIEVWKRECDKLAHTWSTENFHEIEPNRIEYTRTVQLIKQSKSKKQTNTKTEFHFYPTYKRVLKSIVSLIILVFMILLVAVDVGAIALFRVYMYLIFADNSVLQLTIGSLGSTILNVIAIIIMDKIYSELAIKLTVWETPRTKSEFDNALVFKLFAFEFVNCYGSLFYIAFFRRFTYTYTNGLFNLGKNYEDRCDEDNCMALLTTQILVILIFKPFARLFVSVIFPFIKKRYKLMKLKKIFKAAINSKQAPRFTLSSAEFKVFINAYVEKEKEEFDRTIQQEYMEKVMMYGYIMLFGCTLGLAPLFILIANVIDVRVDAKRMLWLYRRPIAQRAQDIGIYYYILQFLNICGIINHGFMIAFATKWSKYGLKNSTENRLMFVVIFEHSLFLLWVLIIWLWPRHSYRDQIIMKRENQMTKEVTLTAKSLNNIFRASMPRLNLLGSLNAPPSSFLPNLPSTIEEEEEYENDDFELVDSITKKTK